MTTVVSGHTGHITELVVDQTAYVEGDRVSLIAYLGIPASVANQVNGKWISIPPGAQEYNQVESGVTFDSALNELELRAPLRTVSTGRVP